ncbi:hypothetical protein [Kitasatospora sp. MMS16-BH015]|uniref:hypothetical protein n=1 Tax=Kitasatospora sp. MMS16-BH015 TaxID=2018025 RepID=UPI00131A5FFD|nr:hypothetical protein [Kitasatospora sp. MMS16-BH015]
MRRQVRAGAWVALVAAVATACSSAADPKPGAERRPSATAGLSTASPEATPTDRSPHGVLLSAELAAHTDRRARYSCLLGGTAATGMLFWAPKTVLQFQRTGSTEQAVVLDTTAYLGGDQATAARLGGRHWERFSAPAGPDGQREVPYAGLVDRLNPVVALAAATAVEAPELLGEEKLGETTAHHYRVATTVTAYVAAQTQLPAPRREALRAALSAGGVSRLTLDLWLGDKDELLQLRRTGSGPTGKLDDTVRYSEYAGATLSVLAPAEADTTDGGGRPLPDLLGRG